MSVVLVFFLVFLVFCFRLKAEAEAEAGQHALIWAVTQTSGEFTCS